MSDFYSLNQLAGKLRKYLLPFFTKETKPTRKNLDLICRAILALNACRSVKFAYDHYLSNFTSISLDAFYKMLAHAKLDRNEWRNKLVELALRPLDARVKGYPIFIIVDDTLVKKQGTKFEEVGMLFDHTAKPGEPKYVNGHCFVTVQICIPVPSQDGGVEYHPVTVSHSMWRKEDDESSERQSKLDIAYTEISKIIPQLKRLVPGVKIGILCDSWYPKGPMLSLANMEDVFLIANVRWDSRLYHMPEPRTGRPGRPATYGKRIEIEDLMLKRIPKTDYSVKYMTGLSPLFPDRTIGIFVSSLIKKAEPGYAKVFVCTNPSALDGLSDIRLRGAAGHLMNYDLAYLPFALYSLRWNIEVAFLELKGFWGMENYMLRVADGIENYVNLQLVVYSIMGMLPLLDPAFSCLKGRSPQERRYVLGRFLGRLEIIQSLALGAQEAKTPENVAGFFEKAMEEANLAV